ncbi:hypothetical protein KAR91_31575, partial [Candidatus Pacearchaeota archaeon]|nr:hypothetical protein [Candidatus Pacearchaeota archaeon]
MNDQFYRKYADMNRNMLPILEIVIFILFSGALVLSAELKNTNSNTNLKLKKPYFVLERNNITAVIINNKRIDDKILPQHRAGYSGLASISHQSNGKNLFVPLYAGLNFEHIFDGTNKSRDILFEPRRAIMNIRRLDDYTVELYQPPTPYWKLESWLTYTLLEDGTLELLFECIPHARTFENGYIGLFFASYIYQPESLDIHFLGHN